MVSSVVAAAMEGKTMFHLWTDQTQTADLTQTATRTAPLHRRSWESKQSMVSLLEGKTMFRLWTDPDLTQTPTRTARTARLTASVTPIVSVMNVTATAGVTWRLGLE